MGLDLSHNCWHGAYSAFNRWRDKLAKVAGYTGHKSKSGFGETTIDIDWGNIEATIGHDLNGKWPAIPVRPDGTPDPLIMLIAHSDCEGKIESKYCAALADRLEGLLCKLEGLEDPGHVGHYVETTKRFIDGLRLAAANNEDIEFS